MGASLTLDSADGSREERVVLMDGVWAGPRPDTTLCCHKVFWRVAEGTSLIVKNGLV